MSKSKGNLVLVSALRRAGGGPDGHPARAAGPALPHRVGLDGPAWHEAQERLDTWRAALSVNAGPAAEATVARVRDVRGRRPGHPDGAWRPWTGGPARACDRGGDETRRARAWCPAPSTRCWASVSELGRRRAAAEAGLGTCAAEPGRRCLRPGLVAAPAQVALELPRDGVAAGLGQVCGVLGLLEALDVLGDLLVGLGQLVDAALPRLAPPRPARRAGSVTSSSSSSLVTRASVALGEGECRRSAAPRPSRTATAGRPGRRRPPARRRCPWGPRTCSPRGRSGGACPRRSEVAVIGSGRVCGTSASSAPRVTNVETPTDWANSSSSMVKDRQRVDGSMPCTRMTSRSSAGGRRQQDPGGRPADPAAAVVETRPGAG